MADINNLTEITENFDTIKTLLNSIRAQGILNTSDVDKLLSGINTKLEKINTEEDIDLIKIFLSELKQNLDERHGVLLSKFGAIESLFSNLLKNSSETLKSSEIKELFDIVATNLSVFSREVVSQKDSLTDITLRLDAMRSDDTQKKEIVKNISFLKNDIERLTNGFDSIVLSLNENFKTVIKSISSIDPSENINKFGQEISDIINSSKTILSALQVIDKKNESIEELLKSIATKEDLNSTKKWLSDITAQEHEIKEYVSNLTGKYYKIDNLSDKIDASVDIIAGLKTLISDNDNKISETLLNKLNELEVELKNISSNKEFDDLKIQLEQTLKGIYTSSDSVKSTLSESAVEIQKIKNAISALNLEIEFKSLGNEINKSEQNIKDFVSQENGKVLQLVDVNTTRALNEISSNAEGLTEKLLQAQDLITALCSQKFSDVEDNIVGLKSAIAQIDENNVSGNNAIYSNITDRLTIFENSLKNSLDKQELSVSGATNALLEQVKNVKDLSGILDYKLDSSVIEINSAKTEFSSLKTAVDEVLALDFTEKVKELKIDLYAVKQDLRDIIESYSGDVTQKVVNDFFGKYELMISKLDSVEVELKQAQTSSLIDLKSNLDSITSSLVDILSYVSSPKDINTQTIDNKLEEIERTVKDNNLGYVEHVRDIVGVIRTQVDNNLKSIAEDTSLQIEAILTSLSSDSDDIRKDIHLTGVKLLDIQKSIIQNSNVLNDNLKHEINALFDKLLEQQNLLIQNSSEQNSELKIGIQNTFTRLKEVQDEILTNENIIAQELKNDIRTSYEKLVDIKDDINTFSENISSNVFNAYDKINSDIKTDFDNTLNRIEDAENKLLLNSNANYESLKSDVKVNTQRLVDIKENIAINKSSFENSLSKILSETKSTQNNIDEKLDIVNTSILSSIDKSLDDTSELKSELKRTIEKIEDTENSIIEKNEINSETIRNDIRVSYEKLVNIQEFLDKNNDVFGNDITSILSASSALRSEFESKIGALKSAVLDTVNEFKQEFICTNADKMSEIKFASETYYNKGLKNSSDMKDELKGELEKIAGSLKLNMQELSDLISTASIKIESTNTDINSKVDSALSKLEFQVEDFTGSIENDIEKVISNVGDLNDSVNNLSGSVTGALSSTLAKILDNFVSLKAFLSNLNEQSTESLRQNVDKISNDFKILSDRLNNVDASIDEDFARQLSLLENGFDTIDSNINLLLEKNATNLSEELNKGLGNIEEKLSSSLSQNITSYQEQLEALFEKISNKNSEQRDILNDIILKLNSTLQDSIEEQNSSLSSRMNDVKDGLKNILDENIKLSLADYEELKAGIEKFQNEITEQNTNSINGIKTQLDDIAKFLSSEFKAEISDIDEVVDSLSNKLTQNIENLSGSTTRLTDEVIKNVDNISSSISSLSEDIHAITKEANEDISSKIDENLQFITNNFKTELASTSESLLRNQSELINKVETTLNNRTSEFITTNTNSLSKRYEELINNLNVSFENKLNAIIASNSELAADELQSMEAFADSILIQLAEHKQLMQNGKELIVNFVKGELDNLNKEIEKETDVIVKDLLEQTTLIKDAQKDELLKLTTQIESSVEDSIYNNINELKSYLDVRTDNTALNSKLDNIGAQLNRSAEDILAASNKLLEASVFNDTISDLQSSNEILINTLTDNLNSKIQEFIKVNVSNKFDEKFVFFDKKFTDTIVDSYEEVKLISTKYNDSFVNIESSIKTIISDFISSKNEINNNITSLITGVNSNIDKLSTSFADLKAQILNKSFDEAFQASVNNQISQLETLIREQLEHIENISDLCCDNLPELTEMNTIVKHNIVDSIDNLASKIDSQDSEIQKELNNLKTDVITQFINLFNQISFVAEQEEILDFIQEKHSELITILSHIVNTVDDVENIKENVSVIDIKVDSLKEDLELINEKITAIMSSEGDIDYVYSLQDLESDIANLRLILNEIKNKNSSKEFLDLVESTNKVCSLFDTLNEDIVSISTRTNKLILASDESYKTLQENLQDFKLVINDLDERTRNFAQESGLDKIDNKLCAINNMIQSGTKTNQVFNQVFEYLAEWVDNAGEQINSISNKVDTLDDLGQIKVMLEDLKTNAEDNTESDELIEALGNIFEKQAKKIASLEAKLDRVIVETTISNKNNKIDMTPLEDTLNRFLVAIDTKIISQQRKIDSIESKLEDVASMYDPKDTAQLTKKVGGMDRQIAKLNKSIEKIAAHVVEK